MTTLTLQELADLADASITAEDSYCGIDLADVDLFYFSGQGNYGAEPSNMVSAATVIAKLAFGVDGSGIRTAAARVPVIMDYNFMPRTAPRAMKC